MRFVKLRELLSPGPFIQTEIEREISQRPFNRQSKIENREALWPGFQLQGFTHQVIGMGFDDFYRVDFPDPGSSRR